jgi:hypothetical protein
MLIVITRYMKLTVRFGGFSRLGAAVVARGGCQAFNLQRLGYRHEGLKLSLLHVDFTLVHELQKLAHDGEGHVFEYDWNVRRANVSLLVESFDGFKRAKTKGGGGGGESLLVNVA